MSTVVVTAPADLHEGVVFDASANGKMFKVTVPAGGVRAGDEIVVPLPTEDDTTQWRGPTGKFRNDLCDCWQTFPGPFFMGCCCFGVLTGQVLQRLKLNPLGMLGDYKNTCMIMTVIYLVMLFLSAILLGATGFGAFIEYGVIIYVVVALMLARSNFRLRYNIPGTTCGDGLLDDCCCAFWCGCCTVIQMHRHTHDEKVYKYELTSKTGLQPDAPEIV